MRVAAIGSIFSIGALLLGGCQTTPDTTPADADTEARTVETEGAPAMREESKTPSEELILKGHVWVATPDGSKQCEGGPGRPLSIDLNKLQRAGITPVRGAKGNDGMMHIQLCGADTGQINAFLIPEKERERAQQVGFVPLPPDAVLGDRVEF